MRGAGDEVGALREGLLEVGAGEAQHMSHVVQDDGIEPGLVHEAADFGHRFLVEHHALAEDDELGAMLLDEFEGTGHVDAIPVAWLHGEVDHRGLVGVGIDGHVVLEGAHRLRAQVSALADVVVHDHPQALGLALAVPAVAVVHQGGEQGGIGHLPADDPGLHLGGAEEAAHLALEGLLHLVDEAGALVVEDVRLVEGLQLAVLGVAEGRVGDRQEPHQRGGGHLGGDQVDAFFLPPAVVPDSTAHEFAHFAAGIQWRERSFALRRTVDDGPRVRRRVAAQVIGDDDRRRRVTADIDLHFVVFAEVAVQEGEADGAELVVLSGMRAQSVSGHLPVGDHGAAGDPAGGTAPGPRDGGAGASHTASDDGDRPGERGKGGDVGEVIREDAPVGFLLAEQVCATHIVPFGRRETHGEMGQGGGEERDLIPLRIGAQLVP